MWHTSEFDSVGRSALWKTLSCRTSVPKFQSRPRPSFNGCFGVQTVDSVTPFPYTIYTNVQMTDVDLDGYSTPEMHRRLGIASSVMGQLDGIWRQQKLSLSTKLRIYSLLVLSSLLYGSETWTLHKTDSERLQVFHMTAQRRILGIKWHDFITNSAIKARTGLGLVDLPLLVTDGHHSLLGHICHLPPDTLAHRALSLCIDVSVESRPATDCKRPSERP